MPERCHLIATEPHRERYAAAELGDGGFATYLPLVLEPVRRGRRVVVDRRPLFPGYLFAWFDPSAARWGEIYRTKGCVAPVRIAGALAALSDGQYAALRALEGADGMIQLPDDDAPALRLAPGDTVSVTAGPWAGFLGEVVRLKGDARVRLLLGALEVEMTVDMVART